MEIIKIDKWDAIIFFNQENKEYTITYAGKGGAIVFGSDLDAVKSKFIEAMQLSCAVKMFFDFISRCRKVG